MKELLIISGKGGAGKTTIAATCFHLAEGRSIGVDCDVDAANFFLLALPKNEHKILFQGGFKSTFNEELCSLCKDCVSACRFNAITFQDNKISLKESMCEGCGVCKVVCPQNAFSLKRGVVGYYAQGNTRWGNFVRARLNPGEDNSGKLVAQLRRVSQEMSEKDIDVQWVIIDGPPGLGCPVKSSMTGVDSVLLVGEASEAGFHNLKRVYKLVKFFNAKAFLFINKYDLNETITESMEAWALLNKVPVLGKLPYSFKVTEAQKQQKSLLEFDYQFFFPFFKGINNLLGGLL